MFMQFFVLLAAAEFGSWQWLMELAGPILVTQAIAGIGGLIGLIFVIRRFLGSDFPAFRTEINGHLTILHADLNALRLDFQQNKLEVARLSERHDSLRGRVDRLEKREEFELDDTRNRRRPRRDNGE